MDEQQKFIFLKAISVFRLPITFTAIRWGLFLGTVLGIHQFVKSRSISNSLRWGIRGSFMTCFAIWQLCLMRIFLFVKKELYFVSIKKFENEQFAQLQKEQLIKSHMKYELGIQGQIQDEALYKKYQKLRNERQIVNKRISIYLQGIDQQFCEKCFSEQHIN